MLRNVPKAVMHFTIEQEAKKKLKCICNKKNMNVAEVVRELIYKYNEDNEEE
jgi:hypothetical protein